MKTSCKFSLVIILMLTVIMYFPSVVSAGDKSCWLEATMERTLVTVREMDADGAGETRLWRGWIEKGGRQKIKSAQGQISYDYRLASSDRTQGDNSTYCDNGDTVRIP